MPGSPSTHLIVEWVVQEEPQEVLREDPRECRTGKEVLLGKGCAQTIAGKLVLTGRAFRVMYDMTRMIFSPLKACLAASLRYGRR